LLEINKIINTYIKDVRNSFYRIKIKLKEMGCPSKKGIKMKVIELSKQIEDIIIEKSDISKIECFEIPVITPNEIDPGSKLELRYLQYLIQKYSKENSDFSITMDK
jgi:hypothetical protein